MDKQLIERIAREVADALDEGDTAACIEFATRFLARIDAERGKSAVAVVDFNPDGWRLLVDALREIPDGTPLFLSPTPAIPEGMALVPIEPPSAYIAAICDETLCSRTTAEYAYQTVIACAQGDMLAAAQGERA